MNIYKVEFTKQFILEHREDWLRVAFEVDPPTRATPGTIFSSPFLIGVGGVIR